MSIYSLIILHGNITNKNLVVIQSHRSCLAHDLSPSMTYHQIYHISNTTGVPRGAGISYTFRAAELTPDCSSFVVLHLQGFVYYSIDYCLFVPFLLAIALFVPFSFGHFLFALLRFTNPDYGFWCVRR